jgi:hypothetical protein
VLHGDWVDVLPGEAPFDLLFAGDGGRAMKTNPGVLELLAPGGTLVLNDLTPGRPGPNPIRGLWLNHPPPGGGRGAALAPRGGDRRGPTGFVGACR